MLRMRKIQFPRYKSFALLYHFITCVAVLYLLPGRLAETAHSIQRLAKGHTL